jgi:hypothetical protein
MYHTIVRAQSDIWIARLFYAKVRMNSIIGDSKIPSQRSI